MTEQAIKRGRGRPPKAKPVVPNKPKVVKPVAATFLLDNLMLALINTKFKEAFGFELTQAQAHAYLMNSIENM